MTTIDELISLGRRMPEAVAEVKRALIAWSQRDSGPHFIDLAFANNLQSLGISKPEIDILSDYAKSQSSTTPDLERCTYAILEFVKSGANADDAVTLLDQCISLTMYRDIEWEDAVATICRTWVLK